MPEPNATPAPLTMTPGVAYGDRAAAEAAFSHASAGDLRAALVRWIKEADYWRNEAGGKAVAIALNHELLSEQRAKLAEAEAQRDEAVRLSEAVDSVLGGDASARTRYALREANNAFRAARGRS